MFYLALLTKRLFDLEIVLAWRGMLQCSNKFSNCSPRLSNSTMHRDMIFRHLDIWRFDTAVLELLSRVSRLSADTQKRQCANGYDQIDWPAITFHLINYSSPNPTTMRRNGRTYERERVMRTVLLGTCGLLGKRDSPELFA